MQKTVSIVALGLLLSLLVASFSFAQGQTRITGYNTARDRYFWTQLYMNGGRDLYCAVRFKKGERVSIEHITPPTGSLTDSVVRIEIALTRCTHLLRAERISL
ncbi:MAG: hypothetical protein ACREX3_13185 [Gammaproteobacteria bacterium]